MATRGQGEYVLKKVNRGSIGDSGRQVKVRQGKVENDSKIREGKVIGKSIH